MLFKRGGLELVCFMLTFQQQELFQHQPAPHHPTYGPRFETKQPVLAEVAHTRSKGQAAVAGKGGARQFRVSQNSLSKEAGEHPRG